MKTAEAQALAHTDPEALAPTSGDGATAEAEFKSAYEKDDVAAIDPRCVPQELDGMPPIGDEIVPPDYDQRDHDTWSMLYDRMMEALPGRASDAYLEGAKTLGLDGSGLPALRDLSARMEKETGWRVARVPGLVHEKDFFYLLSERLFPSTDYIRGPEELDYTPAPDCFHDIFGHMPMLTDPAFADFYQLFGKAALNATGQDRVSLERFHWFTAEFGLIEQAGELRIFGAGIMSSKKEVFNSLSDDVDRRPFDPASIIRQDYDVWHLQDTLFVLKSFESLVDGFRGWARSRNLLD